MDILKRIKDLMQERGWTQYRLASEAMLQPGTINNMFTRKTNPSIITLVAICNAFDMTLSQFFNDDEDKIILSAEEKDLIYRYRTLDKKDKNTVQSLTNTLSK